jgi:glycosyltransferase involved in cell wall biosynthesis
MKLSIITVCYNSEATIEDTIKSVLSQKTADVEYIIVDGRSTDRTMEIVGRYRDKIDVVISERDNGISDAFNKGIRIAKGQYIALLNSDDRYLDGAVGRFFQRVNNDTDVFYGNGLRLYSDGKVKKYMANPDFTLLKQRMPIVHPSSFVRKSAYEKYGMYREDLKYIMDRACFLSMLQQGANFQYDKGFYTVYSMGGASDRSYLTGVVPESYRMDISNGTLKIIALKSAVRRVVKYYLVKIKTKIVRNDPKKVDFGEMLEIISKE